MNRRLAAAASAALISAVPAIALAQTPVATGAEGSVGMTGVWIFVVIFFGACAGFAWMVWRGGKSDKKK